MRVAGTTAPSRAEAARFWCKLGAVSFGGPAAQIALMHRELVVRRGWVTEDRFTADLALCQTLPGPEAQQLAALSAARLHGPAAGVAAGAAFVLPGALLLLATGLTLTQAAIPEGARLGLRAGALALLLPAAWRLLRRHLTPAGLVLAGFGAMAGHAAVPQPVIAAGAAMAGFLLFRVAPSEGVVATPLPPVSRAAAWGAALVWAVPPALAWLALGANHAVTRCGEFALRLAAAGFGGAYALLPEAFRLMHTLGDLPATLAADATALAEAVPGPLLLAVQHAALMAGRAHPGSLSPDLAGVAAAALAAWCLFATSTLLVLGVAPVADRFGARPGLRAALTGVGAAAAGQIVALLIPVARAALTPENTFSTLGAMLAGLGLMIASLRPGLAWTVVPACGLAGALVAGA